MKVAYDIGLLGNGHFIPQSRTGIHRVVQEVAFGLAARTDCQLTLVTQSRFDDAIRLHAATPGFRELPLLVSRRRRLAVRIMKGVNARLYARAHTKFTPSRIVKRLVQRADAQLNNIFPGSAAASLGLQDIYHSPDRGLPAHTKRFKNLRRFITSYDLVPVLFPQFCNRHNVAWIKQLVASVSADDWVIAISESTKRDFCGYAKFDPSRVFVTPLAADNSVFYPATDSDRLLQVLAKYGGIPPEPYILALSSQDPKKNLDRLVRAFFMVAQQRNAEPLNLVLVGNRQEGSRAIDAQIQQNRELRGRVYPIGYVEDVDLAPLYSHAVCFVYPSLYEGFGLPVLEAMSCGCAIVCSNNSSLPEVGGDAAILVAPESDEAIASAILELLNPERRHRAALLALERSRQFSWAKTVDLTVNAYRTAMTA